MTDYGISLYDDYAEASGDLENNTASYPQMDYSLLDDLVGDLAGPLGDSGPSPLPDQVRHLLIAGYVLVMAAAALSNGLVMLVVSKSRKLHTVTNTFLMSLALSDFLIAVLNMPFTLQHYVSHKWTAGLFMCKFSAFMQSIVIYVSILTLAAVAMDRFYAICYPLRARHVHTNHRAFMILCSLWLVSALLSIPNYLVMVVSKEFTFVGEKLEFFDMCIEHFPSRWILVGFTISVYSILYVLPTVLIAIAYGMVAMTLWSRTPIGEHHQGDETRSQESKRIIRMLILLVVVFAISWFPFFTMQVMVLFFDPSYLKRSNVRLVMAFLHLLGYSNACVNPALYCFMNQSFQRQFVRLAGNVCRATVGEPKSKRSAATSALSEEKSSLKTPASKAGTREVGAVGAGAGGGAYSPGDIGLVDIEVERRGNGTTTMSLIVSTDTTP